MKSWQILKLNEFCVTRSGVLSPEHHLCPSEGNILYVKPKDIFFNTIFNTNEHVSKDILAQAGVEIVPKESILIAVSGSNAGNIAILGKEAVANKNVFYATIQNPLIKPKFLYYYLFFNRHRFVKVSKYTSRVSCRYLQKLGIPLPSLKEQDQIIQYLDIYVNQINISINHIKKDIDEINRARQELINRIFLFSPEANLSTAWNVSKLKDCGLVKAGKTPNGSIKEYYGSDYPLFKPSDLYQERQLKNAKAYLSPKGLREAGYVKANSLLICSSGVNLGKVGIIQVNGACSQQMISFTPKDNLIPEFVYFQMISDRFKQQLLKHSKNSMINKSAFKELILLIPNLECQRMIVDKLCREINLLAKKESNLNKKLCCLNDGKCDLLVAAFTNKPFTLISDFAGAAANLR